MPSKEISREAFDAANQVRYVCTRLSCGNGRLCDVCEDFAIRAAYADQEAAKLGVVEADNKVLVQEHQEALGHLNDAETKLTKAEQRIKDDAVTIRAWANSHETLLEDIRRARSRRKAATAERDQMEIRALMAELEFIDAGISPYSVGSGYLNAKRKRLAELES